MRVNICDEDIDGEVEIVKKGDRTGIRIHLKPIAIAPGSAGPPERSRITLWGLTGWGDVLEQALMAIDKELGYPRHKYTH